MSKIVVVAGACLSPLWSIGAWTQSTPKVQVPSLIPVGVDAQMVAPEG